MARRRKQQKTKEFEVCAIKECDMPKVAKGLCHTHYHQISRGYSLKPIGWHSTLSENAQRTRPCKHPRCEKPANTRGLCQSHYVMANQAFRNRTSDARCITPGCDQAATTGRWNLCIAHNYVRMLNGIAVQHQDVIESMQDYRVEQGLSEPEVES